MPNGSYSDGTTTASAAPNNAGSSSSATKPSQSTARAIRSRRACAPQGRLVAARAGHGQPQRRDGRRAARAARPAASARPSRAPAGRRTTSSGPSAAMRGRGRPPPAGRRASTAPRRCRSGTLVTTPGSSSNSRSTSSRMPGEHTTTCVRPSGPASARRSGSPGSAARAASPGAGRPRWRAGWRPAARRSTAARVIAVCATSQSWACTTSGRQRVTTGRAARSSACSAACDHASSDSVVKSICERVGRGPHDPHAVLNAGTAGRAVRRGSPPGRRGPAAASSPASASTCRPEAADDERRVLPGQHQHPHGDGH